MGHWTPTGLEPRVYDDDDDDEVTVSVFMNASFAFSWLLREDQEVKQTLIWLFQATLINMKASRKCVTVGQIISDPSYELAQTSPLVISLQLFHSKLKTLFFSKSYSDSSSSPCLPPRLNSKRHPP